MKNLKKITLLLITILFLNGCSFNQKAMEDINIYTTSYPINYLITSMYEESTGNTLSSSQAQQLFGNEKRNVWLWSDGGLCALIRIAFVGQHSARINTLYTVKEKRGHGYASALVYSVSRMLNEMGLCVTVLADNENPASNKTYQSLGFVKKADVFEYMPDASAPLHSALTYFTDLELPL